MKKNLRNLLGGGIITLAGITGFSGCGPRIIGEQNVKGEDIIYSQTGKYLRVDAVMDGGRETIIGYNGIVINGASINPSGDITKRDTK